MNLLKICIRFSIALYLPNQSLRRGDHLKLCSTQETTGLSFTKEMFCSYWPPEKISVPFLYLTLQVFGDTFKTFNLFFNLVKKLANGFLPHYKIVKFICSLINPVYADLTIYVT